MSSKAGPRAARRLRSSHPWTGHQALLPEIAFPADLFGVEGPEHTQVQIDLVLVDATLTELRRLTLRLSRRAVLGGRIDLWGHDAQHLLDVHVTRRDETWTFSGHVSAGQLDGQQSEALLELLIALRPPNAAGVTGLGMPVRHTTPIRRPMSPPPEDLIQVVHAHAAIERALDTVWLTPTRHVQ